jgi:hypothetical protein
MSENLEVDTSKLRLASGAFSDLANLSESITRDLLDACRLYRDAGGTGEMGKKFNAVYPPGEQSALDFLLELATAFGADGDRLAKAVRIFEETEADTRGAAKKKH